MPGRAIRIALVVGIVGAVLSVAEPALANHIPGATYAGSVSGGGRVLLEISSGGGSLKFTATNVQGDTCSFDKVVTGNIAIVNHAFAGGDIKGSFPTVGTASGTLSYSVPGVP